MHTWDNFGHGRDCLDQSILNWIRENTGIQEFWNEKYYECYLLGALFRYYYLGTLSPLVMRIMELSREVLRAARAWFTLWKWRIL
jgi:hypothetical protein